MPPAKRKATVRRQVLDLKGEGSPSRSTWQTKYQQIQSGDNIYQNGSLQPSSEAVSKTKGPTKTNPLTGLVGNYNSDSESEEASEKPNNSLDAKVEDFLKEIQSISYERVGAASGDASYAVQSQDNAYPTSVTSWQQCYDHNSGYPYYWNVETNEVTWEMPAELKAAIASVAMKQQQAAPYQQPQQQLPVRQEFALPEDKKESREKPVCRYPWQADSDSEDEKIEMITSFGPQSGGEESEEDSEKAKSKNQSQKSKKVPKGSIIGPQLPIGSLLSRDSKRPSDSDDPEGESINETSYETSSLLTHRVQDTGPPGDDSFNANNDTDATTIVTATKVNSSSSCSEVPTTSESASGAAKASNPEENRLVLESCDKVTDKVGKETSENCSKNLTLKGKESCLEFADDVIAEIEKEMPPDYGTAVPSKSEKSTKQTSLAETKFFSPTPDNPVKTLENVNKSSGISGIALLANYEDDSEPEECSVGEKRKTRESNPVKPIFPIEITEEKSVKPLFPCINAENEKSEKSEKELFVDRKLPPESSETLFGTDSNLPEPGALHKAFKRKKRIEFATTNYGPSSSSESKTSSPEYPSTQYNMDPTSNDHRGFGFSSSSQFESAKKPSKYHSSWIQFVKTETINVKKDSEQKNEAQSEAKLESNEDSSITNDEIEDSASLLKEKVTFLTEGKEEISPVNQMAIQLETLFVAWQQGALSKMYFSRWVKEKCSDLIRHEKSAAPPGWTCLWDRKSKRYYYRNTTTKAIQWDYPNVESPTTTTSSGSCTPAAPPVSKPAKETDAEGGGEEMELCFTPPLQSSSEEDKVTDEQPSTPPPPVISSVNEAASSSSPTPPPPPQISSCETDASAVKTAKRKKRKRNEEVTSSSEGDIDSTSAQATTSSNVPFYTDVENQEQPPLPPMPPPPPPPPEEPPPPPPNSPPPLSLDPDQPLPPGVDEPEYAMYRRLSPKQSYKKTQPDSSTYPSDVIMTYGYGMAVASQNTQSVLSIQPVDYHGYVHDAVASNHYVMQTSHVIHCPAKKSKLSLTSELDSFYSDIAMLDSGTSEPPPAKASTEVYPVQEPVVPPVTPSVTSTTTPVTTSVAPTDKKLSESSSSNGVKKRKKTKLTPGLSMKKKGVSSLVAKWQQVQQEVRRVLNSDDDDDDGDISSSHK